MWRDCGGNQTKFAHLSQDTCRLIHPHCLHAGPAQKPAMLDMPYSPRTALLIVHAQLGISFWVSRLRRVDPFFMKGPCVDPLGCCPLDSLYHRAPRVHGGVVALSIWLQAVEEEGHACKPEKGWWMEGCAALTSSDMCRPDETICCIETYLFAHLHRLHVAQLQTTAIQ